MNWSFQLYSARNFQPWAKVLETLGKLGYTEVEGYGGLYQDPAGLRAELDKNGLKMPSGHFSLDMLENDFDTALSTARTLGMGLVVCPHIAAELRPSDAGGWRAFGERLGKVGKRFAGEGITFGWHNHDFEFVKLDDDTVPQEHILDAAPDIAWEIDVAWVIRGGGDPMLWIDRYAERIAAIHVKDIAPEGEATDEDGWADVGYGTVDWKGLVRTLRDRTAAKYFVMEHDNPNDFERFAKRSIDAAKIF
ncbi:TIM barrel protein [Mesorhizobium sp. NBSH29]|uniref:sugar phosphate isomerase/epimerase family protein n=1 Tax=Mesorhizobium sp. NBSH29 TaxID=2654249 RepID=UPI0018969A82|nr:sugar phosphate isomerase/epimerase [Mesorhizobium sp. NBSH29]QPC86325.1 TIM barrel protein [Mesorhizobium sp. NBSH29]